MDWYYPVLGGAVRGQAGLDLIAEPVGPLRPAGARASCCVDTNPWVTGAETCELAMALDTLGDRERALTLLRDMQHLRSEDGKYWTGYVYPDDVNWPVEHTTYTAAAVILAVDALSGTTPGSDIFRASTLPSGLPRDRPRVRLRDRRLPAAGQLTGSPASPRTRVSTRIEPSAVVSSKPLSSARR